MIKPENGNGAYMLNEISNELKADHTATHDALAPAPSLFQGDLNPQTIAALSSEYLTNGVFQDRFELARVKVDGHSLFAQAKITSFGISPTDKGGFHLTAPTVFRIVSQLVVIHGHTLLGLKGKRLEVWVKEHYFKHSAPVRDPQNIEIEYQINSLRRARSNSKMVGFEFSGRFSDGAVEGRGSAFFDLTEQNIEESVLRTLGI